MPDKGKFMTQTYYERYNNLISLYQEALLRKEMNTTEAVTALRMIGYSTAIAATRVNEWEAKTDTLETETASAKKLRQKKQVSLEKYIIKIILGKKNYIRLRFEKNELTKEETIKELIKSGYKDEIAEEIVSDWAKQNL